VLGPEVCLAPSMRLCVCARERVCACVCVNRSTVHLRPLQFLMMMIFLLIAELLTFRGMTVLLVASYLTERDTSELKRLNAKR
jgi:hypothetical protein